ncbi:MAG: patatin-like phospholipase family protein [Rhizobiaceae bacterium]|nr:patatin-like phospholipase family protein [Rhizobiaceae bacterium]
MSRHPCHSSRSIRLIMTTERKSDNRHKRSVHGQGGQPLERKEVLVDLALQGGGSHGAFTWGVLDRLLEEPWLRIEAISGTSAGAMNAAVLADGWTDGGAEGARAALDAYWLRVSKAAAFSPLQRTPIDRMMGRWSIDTSPGYVAMDLMSRMVSPYQLNPFGFNPLDRVLRESIDFERLARSPVKLFITATSVRTGRGRVFRNAQISVDVLLASACLPTMFQAVEIDGEAYWDGGFAGNPTITPLVRESEAKDIILVQINPRERTETPRSASDILNRLNEISFNSPLLKELRMIALLRQVADPGNGEGKRWAAMRPHRIMTDKLAEFGASSKLNAEWEFLSMLKTEGRNSAAEFLLAHGDDLGKRPSADLGVMLDE